LSGLASRLPFYTRGKNKITATNMSLFVASGLTAAGKPGTDITNDDKSGNVTISIAPGGVTLTHGIDLGGFKRFDCQDTPVAVGDWQVVITDKSATDGANIVLDKMFLVFRYTLR